MRLRTISRTRMLCGMGRLGSLQEKLYSIGRKLRLSEWIGSE